MLKMVWTPVLLISSPSCRTPTFALLSLLWTKEAKRVSTINLFLPFGLKTLLAK